MRVIHFNYLYEPIFYSFILILCWIRFSILAKLQACMQRIPLIHIWIQHHLIKTTYETDYITTALSNYEILTHSLIHSLIHPIIAS